MSLDRSLGHRLKPWLFAVVGLVAGAGLVLAASPKQWKIHSKERPQPPVVDPGGRATTGEPPSDAIVLFGGEDLSAWESTKGGPAKWDVKDGVLVVNPDAGSIRTKKAFGDCQIHVEWASPKPAEGHGQHRGNSGVFPMGRYEVQILDSYKNKTYPDGQAAAIYGQYPPLVNASRPPGQWQTYDILFRGPRFDEDGNLTRPAKMAVLHNGVAVQPMVELSGPSGHKKRPKYQPHPEKLPLVLQAHGHAVRFRNIWIRPLPPERPVPENVK